MSAANPSQLALLSDHIKLSLLERARARSLNLSQSSQDAEISRSLDSFRDGLAALEASSDPTHTVQLPTLRTQYAELLHQFDGTAPPSASITQPSTDGLAADFSQARGRPNSSIKRRPSGASKSVRFTDNPEEEEQTRAALMPYSDDVDEDAAPDHAALTNQQIHAYHSKVLREQDEQLDTLGASISRQRELSIQIGDELDEQAQILDDVDDGVMRHQSTLDRARNRVDRIARKAKDNWSMLTISILIIILVLLIIVLK